MGEREEILEILKRKARGYMIEEISEELSPAEGEMTVTKIKKNQKHVPPDLTAIKMLLEYGGAEETELSPEKLAEEKTRLLKLLKAEDSE